jgi:hypothetical protein
MMKRPNGATLAEIMAMTGWQAHTVRASSAFSAAGEGRKSNLQRMTQASGLTVSPNSSSRPSRAPLPGCRRERRCSLCRPHCSTSDVTDRSLGEQIVDS